MTEFVEEKLEKLLPLFESLKEGPIFAEREVLEFAKRCRDYEYRIQKKIKSADDFITYADYFISALKLVRLRRNRLQYHDKMIEIDGALKSKIATIYRMCTERFKGKREAWRKRLDFLKCERMLDRCSKAYLRFLQVFSHDLSIREEAARWEFEENNSVTNARFHLQMGLRKDSKCSELWETFFDIEMRNTIKLLKRKKALNEEMENVGNSALDGFSRNKNDEIDPLLNFKAAEIVVDHATTACPNLKNEFLLKFWRKARSSGTMALELEKKLFEQLCVDYTSEESWIAKYETRSDQEDVYDIFDEACKRIQSEKMLRIYISICEDRSRNDAFANIKLSELLKELHTKGFASLSDYCQFVQFEDDSEIKKKILYEAVNNNRESSGIWLLLLNHIICADNTDKAEIQNLLYDCENLVRSDEMLEIYKLAINWSIENAPSEVEGVFQRAILRLPFSASSKIKCIQLRYLYEAHKNNPDLLSSMYFLFCSHPPNGSLVHKTFINLENKMKNPNHKLIMKAFEYWINERGRDGFKCWLEYASYMLVKNPVQLPKIYQRAVACLKKGLIGDFNESWTFLLQNKSKHGKIVKRKTLKRVAK